MSEMIERVARAVFAESHEIGNTHGDFDILMPEVQEVFIRFARAAIEAMREPTATMVSAGSRQRPYREDDGDYDGMEYRGNTEGTWQAMIDAALKEEA